MSATEEPSRRATTTSDPPGERISHDSAVEGSGTSSWRSDFLAILNNSAKTSKRAGPIRNRGFIVRTHGSESLQEIQALCQDIAQGPNTCLTARYRVASPVLGNLLAAVVRDLARLERGPEAEPPVGVLLPLTQSLLLPPWATLRSCPFGELAEQAQLDDERGALSTEWISTVLRQLSRSGVLQTGVRLVVFAEVEQGSQQDWADILAIPDLPERMGLVVSGLTSTIPVPRDLAWDAEAIGTTGPVLDLEIEPANLARAVSYVEAPLAGDQPAHLDVLHRIAYAHALATLVTLPDTVPMTIGVHAPWGRGKSSFMRFVQWELVRSANANQSPTRSWWPWTRARADEQDELLKADRTLQNPTSSDEERRTAQHQKETLLANMTRKARREVVPVWFNAWRYDGAEQIWAGLTHEITRSLELSLPWHRRVWARFRYAVTKQGGAFWFGLVAPVTAALLVGGLFLLVGRDRLRDPVTEELPSWAGWLAAAVPPLSLALIVSYLFWRSSAVLAPVSERLLEYVRAPDYREHMGYQHEVLEDLRFLTDRLEYRGHRPRVVVFIDDLDRCSDEKVLETLQAVNLLLTASGFYVFLGIDTHMIGQAIAREYSLAEGAARAENYLRKIIQLSIQLPEPDDDLRFALIEDFFSQDTRRRYLNQARASGTAPLRQTETGLTTEGQTAGDRSGYRWTQQGVRRPKSVELDRLKDTVDELDAFNRLKSFLPGNPREIKRIGNLHRLVKIMVQRPEAPPSRADQRLLVAWLVFCLAHSHVAERLLTDARAMNGQEELRAPKWDALIEQLNKDVPEDSRAELTAAKLARGTPLAEATAISSLFQEPEELNLSGEQPSDSDAATDAEARPS